jgi:hypothetical protein
VVAASIDCMRLIIRRISRISLEWSTGAAYETNDASRNLSSRGAMTVAGESTVAVAKCDEDVGSGNDADFSSKSDASSGVLAGERRTGRWADDAAADVATYAAAVGWWNTRGMYSPVAVAADGAGDARDDDSGRRGAVGGRVACDGSTLDVDGTVVTGDGGDSISS